MNKKSIFVALSFFAILTGAKAQLPVYLDESQPMETRISDAMSRMTLEEKVALCHANSKFNTWGVPRLGIPGLQMSDGPHGVREEMDWSQWKNAGWTNDSCTAFPALTCLAATWNPEMAAIYGKAIGEEARYRNKNVLLGPGVNIYRTPLNGRNFEYMGEDPYLSSVMCVPYIKGVQENGVACCVKHFALNNQEKYRWNISVEVSDRALREIYLPAFKAAVQQGEAWSLMGAYNQIRGTHACHNPLTLQKILKGEWKWDGAVVSDWDGTHDTHEAALNGLDIEMGTASRKDKGIGYDNFTFDQSYLASDYLDMLRTGKLPMSTVDEKVERILRLIFRTAMNTRKPFGNMDYAAHSAVARQIGTEGIVLLKNSAKGLPAQHSAPLLPINGDMYSRILVVGDNATRRLTEGGGSSELKVQHETSVLAALKEIYGDKIQYTRGYAPGKTLYDRVEEVPSELTDSLRDVAVGMAREADIVIFVGGLNKNKHQDCEDSDRQTYGLPFSQPELIKALLEANPAVVTVLMSGNAVELPQVADMPSIVQAWYLGSEAGPAVADILSGKVNPSGKLPFSFPVKLEDCGANSFGQAAYPGNGKKVEYKEDILVGYRWHDTKNIPALFPFGHGLSYTQFEYGKVSLSSSTMQQGETVTVSVSVKNSGKRQGKEVVQLYIGDDKCSVARPKKELKRFAKISLESGESQTVSFDITTEDLQFFDDQSQTWTAEPGKFTVYIGSSSTDIRSKASFTLK
ncbi:MAG: glycoside hydrolase family 3 C-terminal domain-containing protein [Bacteroides sp.]|nr:glycoside hydrolase family 3 C-terminal domain-containing protein [Roseburia sp.]MCM1346986.1 glycoside hydrolase family 3 C-terminal domain-containing protein [Bacteroides sp.]MCM1422174.1 glycoside hydrolase family 3 C-terminal domain-containing protein [Bacteroides sp.]